MLSEKGLPVYFFVERVEEMTGDATLILGVPGRLYILRVYSLCLAISRLSLPRKASEYTLLKI
jgi:hypothetical protein